MATKKPKEVFRADQRMDGWFNTLTNLGVRGLDKRTGAQVLPHIILQPQLEAMYQVDDIAARIVDRLPEEMVREGFKIIIPGDKNDIPEKVMADWDRFEVIKKLELALKWERLYGGAAILVGLDDGLSPAEPVDLSKIRKIDYLTVLDKFRIFPSAVINYDVTSPNFGMPDYYRVYTMQTTLPMIHHTRIIRFNGVDVPWRMRAFFNYWGDSIYGRLYQVIRDFQSTHASAALIVQDFTQFIFKLKNLTQILAQGQKGDSLLMKRLELLGRTASIVNAIVIQDDEDAERKTTNISGLPELIRMINNRLVAATDMPHTILLGESPSGLGASGDSEKIDWYDHVKNKQKIKLQPQIMKLLEFFFASKRGPTNGKVPERFAIEFNPLWQQDENEAADIRFKQAQADQIYITNQVLTPEEVMQSRFGSGQYSTETQLDNNLRNAISESVAQSEALNAGAPPETYPEAAELERDPGGYIVNPPPKLRTLKKSKQNGPPAK